MLSIFFQTSFFVLSSMFFVNILLMETVLRVWKLAKQDQLACLFTCAEVLVSADFKNAPDPPEWPT